MNKKQIIMKKVTQKQKNKLAIKLNKYKRKGLMSYSNYLKEQLKGAKSKSAYKKYLKAQLKSNKMKIAALELEM